MEPIKFKLRCAIVLTQVKPTSATARLANFTLNATQHSAPKGGANLPRKKAAGCSCRTASGGGSLVRIGVMANLAKIEMTAFVNLISAQQAVAEHCFREESNVTSIMNRTQIDVTISVVQRTLNA